MNQPPFGQGPFGRGPFGFGPERAQAPPADPLVAVWAQMEQDFPLECDWMLQDLAACGYPCTDPARPAQYPLRWLGPWADKNLEKTLILHAVNELGDQGKRFQTELENLDRPETQPYSAAWLELYARGCHVRREQRLGALEERCPAFIFTKHFNMGGSHYAFTEGLSDAQSERHFIPGAALCRCEIDEGVLTVHTLLDDPKGVIRDPDVSYDGKRVLFSWKKSDRRDDYHLYEMDLASGDVCQLIAPVRPTPPVRVDRYGQQGELWQYPYPLSETEFLVSCSPWGESREPLRFGLYYTTIDGRRELLVSDPDNSCNQPVPLQRPTPHVRPFTLNFAKDSGSYYVQDVYAGPGLKGIARGTARKLRVVGLDFRAAAIGGNHNRGEAGMAYVCTPISIAQGSWQAKTVHGETPIENDGSAFFKAPARTPLYFQVVDQEGCVIQTMRSWTVLQPGENASCVGCHEQKDESPRPLAVSEAMRRGPKPLEPFYGPPRGFSFAREIQPILDRHCTRCHYDQSDLPWRDNGVAKAPSAKEDDSKIAFSLLPDTTTDWAARRRFSDGYLALTGAVWGYDNSLEGRSRAMVNWISPQSGPPMRQPYSSGSATSELMTLLKEGHKGVQLDREDIEKIACWIDLVVPYCGDYQEANAWSPFERARYNYFLAKRQRMKVLEAENIRKLIESPK